MALQSRSFADTVTDWAYEKFDNDPYIQGAAPYMDKAIAWARETNLKIIIDLHGAPGSQNGFDNSGHRIKTEDTHTLGWTRGETVKQTLKVIEKIANMYAKKEYQDVVIAIALLNEPVPARLTGSADVARFYKEGYGKVRSISEIPVIISDAFEEPSFWNDVLPPGEASNGWHDFPHHKRRLINMTSHCRSSPLSGLSRGPTFFPLLKKALQIFSDEEVALSPSVSSLSRHPLSIDC
jgi:glucan 1,3-beta-glucosidase